MINLWFPKQAQGTALGINGLGNFGVTIAQFTIPLVIGFSLLGASDKLRPARPRAPFISRTPLSSGFPSSSSARPPSGLAPRIIPAEPKTLASQLVAGKRLHTWVLSFLYFLTFGCFVAMGASLPLIIKEVFAAAPGGAPEPIAFRAVGGGHCHGDATRSAAGWRTSLAPV